MLLSFSLQLATVYSPFLNNECVTFLSFYFTILHAFVQALSPVISDLASTNIITSIDLNAIIAHNPTIAHPLLVGLLTNANPDNNNPRPFLDILPFLPPTLPTFDLYGRLLRDQTRVTVQGYSTVADLVLMEILGCFVHECINWLENAEKEEKAGNISDDRFGKGVQNVRPILFFIHLWMVLKTLLYRLPPLVMSILSLSHQIVNRGPDMRCRFYWNGAFQSS